MDRRRFLRMLSLAGAGGLLAACGRSQGASAPTESAVSADPLALVAPGAEPELSVVSGSFEQLTGTGHPFAFGVFRQTDDGAEPLGGADLRLHVVRDGRVAAGPVQPEFHEVQGNPLGVYVAPVDLEQPGVTSFVVVTADGGLGGSDTLQVVDPAASAFPAPGHEAIAVPTPTPARMLGFSRLCTREPACAMHEVSLEQALRQGRPVALSFATPAYCQTAICGPVVDVVAQVRSAGDWGDTAFIHCEIYSDDGQTVAEPVQQWQLPSEPWLYGIDSSGVIRARADGPLMTLPDQVAALVERAVA